MLRKLIGVGVALAVAVTATAGPAGAATFKEANSKVQPSVDPATVAAAIKAAYDAYKTFAGGGSSAAATAQIIAAIQSAQRDIINHIDAVAAADARACAHSAVINFPDFDNLTTDNKQNFALNATSCITQINSLMSAVTSGAALDQLGFSVNAVGPIALMARSKAGLHNDTLIPVLRESNQKIRTSLTPRCSQLYDADSHKKLWFCTAYNGNRGDSIIQARAQEDAMVNTSWEVAQTTLTQLTGL
ncbi:hypothetical protein [Actinomadura decatromicini]|uniref:Uncharacterized protein n=1 Tax=Actinomadura decatromicini TaxID=2604572 RepID=A0A5D3FS06_9ACTN|nr:hypothetical protein [Actinomadura decatromicini]TYK50874.1 hypothetical protein FXF68_10430 [Actinomadura decatromicini]